MFEAMAVELIVLLEKSGDQHWANWFRRASDLYAQGKEREAFSKVLGAYGGMGSFNDVFWDLPKKEFDRLEHLKGEIWKHSKNHLK